MQSLSTPGQSQGSARNWLQATSLSTQPFPTLLGRSQPMDKGQDKKLHAQEFNHPRPKSMMHSLSAGSLSTADSLRGSSSGNGSSRLSAWYASSCESTEDGLAHDFSRPRNPSCQWLHTYEQDSIEDSLGPAKNSASMELQRTLHAQEKARRWVSTAMSRKITCLEKELEGQGKSDRKQKTQKDVLDRQRSQAQMTRLETMEGRHKRQHDVYEEAQRIVVEKQQQALEKMQRWDEQVQSVMSDREHNHQIRKDVQQMASRAMESLNDKIHQQQVQSKINPGELRDHMTRCLSHKLFDPIPVEHVTKRVASSPRALHSSRSEHMLHSPRFENGTPTPRKARVQSPQYRYRPISALAPKTPSLSGMLD